MSAPARPSRAEPGHGRGHLPLWYLVDFLLGFGLVWDRAPIPGINQPFGIALLALAVFVAAFRRPHLRVRRQAEIVLIFLAMLVFAIAVSEMNGLDWGQRATKMVLLLVFALCVASARLNARHLLIGLTVGMMVNAGLFYAGAAPNAYPPYLTGFLGDKNVAGLFLGVVALAGLPLYRSRRWQLVHFATFFALVWLTGSRTSIAGVGLACIWLLLRNRTWLLARLALAVALIWVLNVIEAEFARVGMFAARKGTDWFREQIDLATTNKVALSPWFGDGLTTAWVYLDNGRFMYFHDSYAALRVEGGIPMMVAMLSLVVLYAGGLLRESRVSPALACVEGAVIVVLVCAWKLGEVFFTTPAFLVLGLAWGIRFGVERPADISVADPSARPARASRTREVVIS